MHTFLSTKSAQNLAWALWKGSEDRNGDPLSFQTSSIYSTIMSDSQMGLPSWTRTGIFLWIGFISISSQLLFTRSCSLYSYSIPFSASAILALIPNMLTHLSNRTTSLPIISFNNNIDWVTQLVNKMTHESIYDERMIMKNKIKKHPCICRRMWYEEDKLPIFFLIN